MNKSLYSFLIFIFFLILCFTIAGLGSIFTSQSINGWYTGLQKPSFNPPNWIFGPVWTILYFTIAISGWLIWKEKGFVENFIPFLIFALQLILNLSWSILFFGLRQPGFAFMEILILWLSILITLIFFWRIRPIAGIILIPYLVWVGFAAILNYSLWKLNP